MDNEELQVGDDVAVGSGATSAKVTAKELRDGVPYYFVEIEHPDLGRSTSWMKDVRKA